MCEYLYICKYDYIWRSEKIRGRELEEVGSKMREDNCRQRGMSKVQHSLYSVLRVQQEGITAIPGHQLLSCLSAGILITIGYNNRHSGGGGGQGAERESLKK